MLRYFLCRNEAVSLNRIFGHQEDKQVQYKKELASQLRKDMQKPNAIFSLRKTRNIKNLLYDTKKSKLDEADNPQQLYELLDPLPFEKLLNYNGDALLFPFLVVEAKSGKSANDWYSINLQTAFPIRAFLQIQARLKQAANQPHVKDFEPLVWFMSCKGEDWRLSMAFIKVGCAQENGTGTVDYVSYPTMLIYSW